MPRRRTATGAAAVLAVWALVLVVGYLPAAAEPGGTGTLSGVVTDESGVRLPGAEVSVIVPGRAITTTSNANGEYRFDFLPLGSDYLVMIALEGFETLRRVRVEIKEGRTTSLQSELSIAPVPRRRDRRDALERLGERQILEALEPPYSLLVALGSTPQATAFQRRRADGTNSLGIAYGGFPIDELEIRLSAKIRRRLEVGAINEAWEYDAETGTASGPPTQSFRLRLDFQAGTRLPSRLTLEASYDEERVFGGKVEVGRRPQVDPAATGDLNLPGVIVPGEPFFFGSPSGEPLHFRLDYGAVAPGGTATGYAYPSWEATSLGRVIGEHRQVGELFGLATGDAEDGGSAARSWLQERESGKLHVSVAPVGDFAGPAQVIGVDEYGETVVSSTWDPLVVNAHLFAGPAVLTGVSELNFAGQPVCLCGHFPYPGVLDQVQFGGDPAGAPTGFSPYVATFKTATGLTPGPLSIGWSPEFTQGLGGPVETEVIAIRAGINDEVIQRGGTTGLELVVVGTDKPVLVELENLNPERISMSPADKMSVYSTGGPGSNHVPGVQVTGKKTGTYAIDYRVTAGRCPCVPSLPELAQSWTEEMELLTEAIGSGDPELWSSFSGGLLTGGGSDSDSESDTDSDSDGADCGQTLSLFGDRFEAEVEWRDSEGNVRRGSCQQFAPDVGAFSFLADEPWEILVKVLDGCSSNDNFWVFFAATTDVEYTISVTDTESNQTRSYQNPLGQAAPAVTDTAAFATCP